MSLRLTRSALLSAFLLSACSSDSAEGAAHAPPPLPGAQRATPSQGEPSGAIDPAQNPLAALQALGALGQQAQKALGGAGTAAAVVNWRELSPFLADTVGSFKADGEVDGNTTGMEGFKVTTVKRSYKGQGGEATVEIVDTSFAPMLRAPFAMVHMIQEDSSQGYKRGTQLKGQPAISEWNERQKDSQVHLLLGDRFLVNVEVNGAPQPLAEGLAQALDIPAIVALAAKAQAAK